MRPPGRRDERAGAQGALPGYDTSAREALEREIAVFEDAAHRNSAGWIRDTLEGPLRPPSRSCRRRLACRLVIGDHGSHAKTVAAWDGQAGKAVPMAQLGDVDDLAQVLRDVRDRTQENLYLQLSAALPLRTPGKHALLQ